MWWDVAIQVAKIATGEVEDKEYMYPNKVKGGRIGASVLHNRISDEERTENARKRLAQDGILIRRPVWKFH